MQKIPCKNVDYQEQESIFRINAQFVETKITEPIPYLSLII